jgi:hypothetical protein
MKLFEELNDDNFLLYAAKHYYNPVAIDADEFFDDLARFKYIKKLISRYNKNGILSERLLLNHFVVIFNVFGIPTGLKMLEYKIGLEHWPIVKPFLIYLRVIHNTEYTDYKMDSTVVEALRNI